MATYGKINSSFWSSPTIRALSDDGKMMAIYLLTSPHTTICGAFRLPDGYVTEDLNWPLDRISKTLGELSRQGFATRCELTRWVVVHKFLEWNPPQNANQWKAVFKKAAEVPKGVHWKNRFETVLKQFSNPDSTIPTESESESDVEPFRPAEAVRPVLPAGGSVKTKTLPTANNGVSGSTTETWDAYSRAYEFRYGVAPARSAQSSSMLKTFLRCVPHEEGPEIAAWYVNSNEQFYVTKKHPVRCLVNDAQKLRTEWATRTHGSQTTARLADQTAHTGAVFSKLIQEAANGEQKAT